MCEPAHSITQWNDANIVRDTALEVVSELPKAAVLDFLNEELTGTIHLPSAMDDDKAVDEVSQWLITDLGVELPKLQAFIGEDAKFLSQIEKFYHLSRFGDGHSESRVAKLGRTAFIPPYSAYEVEWWAREIKFDFASSTSDLIERKPGLRDRLNVRRNKEHSLLYKRIKESLKSKALKACEQYALRSSIGDPKILRRFLEETILTSKAIGDKYVKPFDMLLSPKGRNEFERRLKLADVPLSLDVTEREARVRLAKIICGLSRNRIFMNDAWADVPRFWKQE